MRPDNLSAGTSTDIARAGGASGYGELAVRIDPGPRPVLLAESAQSVPQQGPPSPAQTLLRSLQQVQGGATRVSPEVIRAAIQLTSTSCKEAPASNTAPAPPAATQTCGGHVLTAPGTVQPANHMPAVRLAQPQAEVALRTSSPQVRYGCTSAAAAALQVARPPVSARQSWLIPARRVTPPPPDSAPQRPCAPINLRMMQPRSVPVATAVAPQERRAVPAPRAAQPQSAFQAVLPASQATLPNRPIARWPHQSAVTMQSTPLPVRNGIGRDGIAIGVPVIGADSRPVDNNAARVAHAACDAGHVSKALARRQLAGIFARPPADGPAPAKAQMATGQLGMHALHPRTPSGQLGLPGSLCRPERPCERLCTVRSLSPSRASWRSLHDFIPGLIPHGESALHFTLPLHPASLPALSSQHMRSRCFHVLS